MPNYETDLVMANFHCRHLSTTRASIVTLAFNDGAIQGSALTWANDLQTAWGNAMKTQLTTEASWFKTTVLKGNGTSEPEVAESTTAEAIGLFAMGTPPPNVAVLVKKRTGFGGRANRGRIYLPWSISEGAVDEVGGIIAGDRTSIQNAINVFANAVPFNTAQVIANRVYDLPWDSPARSLIAVNIGKPVTSMLVDTRVATQRRRLR